MNGKTRRSLQELSAEVATNPNSTAFVDLAAAYRERGDVERALRLCLRGLQRHPTHVEAHYELGLIYEAGGQRELALDEWAIVRQLAPEHLPSRLALARLYLVEGRHAAAAIELQEAQEIAPRDPRVRGLRGELEAVARRETNGGSRVERRRAGLFDEVRLGDGIIAVLLVDSDGRVQQGRLLGQDSEAANRLGLDMSGVKAEAERVVSYLDLGKLQRFAVESQDRRIAASACGDGLIILVTSPQVPPGKAARTLKLAKRLAEERLTGGGK